MAYLPPFTLIPPILYANTIHGVFGIQHPLFPANTVCRDIPQHLRVEESPCANGSAATRTVQLVHIYVPYVLWLKDQATRKGAVSVPTLRRLWTVSDSFKLR